MTPVYGQPPIRVSVIIPCFNAADFVEAAVRSVLAQTLTDFECILVDDCSTDETAAVLAALAEQDKRIRIIHLTENSGPSAARNVGIDVASGEWLALLDSDDLYEPARLQLLVEAAEMVGADFMADNQRVVRHPDGHDLGTAFSFIRKGQPEAIDLELFLAHSIPVRGEYSAGYLKPIIRRAFLDEHAIRYDERFTVGEDFLFYFEALRLGARFFARDEALYRYTKRPASLSRSGGWTLRVLAGMSEELLAQHFIELSDPARDALSLRIELMKRRAQALDLATCIRAFDPRGALAQIGREPGALFALGREFADVLVQRYRGLQGSSAAAARSAGSAGQ